MHIHMVCVCMKYVIFYKRGVECVNECARVEFARVVREA
jgi:hypothetical protein